MPTEREIVEVLVKDRNNIDDILAMGLFLYYKWDQIFNTEERQAASATLEQMAWIGDNFSENDFIEVRSDASRLLQKYQEDAIKRVVSADKWLIPIVQGVIAAFLYSVLLVIILLVINKTGIDLLKALGFPELVIRPEGH